MIIGWVANNIDPDQGVQLILAYNCARPAILVAGKGWGGMFLFLLFLQFHSCFCFFLAHGSLSSPLLYLFSLSLGDNTKWPTRVDVSLNPNAINIDPDQIDILWHLIWVNTVCSGLSVQILRINMLTLVLLNKLRSHAHFWFLTNQITWSGLLL